jgi:type IV pilus assembly protein PilY1
MTDGERVVDKALVAGKMALFTTFVPESDVCKQGGEAFLYALSYTCDPLEDDPFRNAGFDEAGTSIQNKSSWDAGESAMSEGGKYTVAKLGSSMPSRPVLDSSGEYVFIQTSDSKIHRIKVELPQKEMIPKYWKVMEDAN